MIERKLISTHWFTPKDAAPEKAFAIIVFKEGKDYKAVIGGGEISNFETILDNGAPLDWLTLVTILYNMKKSSARLPKAKL